MSILIYAGFVVAGAVLLLIEAWRNFSSPLAAHPFELHPILKGVEVEKLCTTREWISGFLFYSLLYLVSYAIILGSTVVFEIVNNARSTLGEVGAIGGLAGSENSPFQVDGTDYGKPIFIAAFLIAFLSVGVIKPVEGTMRSLAHRVAGVPSGVYRVIQELHKLKEKDFEKYSENYPRPLYSKFEALKKRSKKMERGDQTDDVMRSLATIDCLSKAIIGGMRSLYFPLADLEKFKQLTDQLEGEIADLYHRLETLDSSDEKMEGFHEAVTRTSDNTLALFSVLYIRNNRSAMKVHRNNPVDRTVIAIEEGYNAEQNTLAMSIFISVLVSLFAGWFLYTTWFEHNAQVRPQITDKQFSEIWAGHKAAGAIDNTRLGCKLDERRWGKASPNGAQTTEPEPLSCAAMQMEAQDAFVSENRAVILTTTFWDTISTALLVLAVAIPVVIGREVRREQNSWKDWRFSQFPFLRMTGMAILPCLFAMLAVVIGRFLEVAWNSGFVITQSQILALVTGGGTFFLLQMGSGLILSFSFLIIMDKRKDMHWGPAIALIVVPSAAVYALYTWLVVLITQTRVVATPDVGWIVPLSLNLRDTLVLSVLPITFLILFAFLLKRTDRKRAPRKIAWPEWLRWSAISGRPRGAVAASILAGVLIFMLYNQAFAQTAQGTAQQEARQVQSAMDTQRARLLRIGVRTDARPFSFHSDNKMEVSTDATPGPLTEAQYSGYIVKICDAVLTEMLIKRGNRTDIDGSDIGIIPIDKLSNADGEKVGRFEALGDQIDILCDPSTITTDRRGGNIISAPLYLTGISYLTSRDASSARACPLSGHLIGIVGDTTASRAGLMAIVRADELPKFHKEIITVVQGDEDPCAEEYRGRTITSLQSCEQVNGNSTGIYNEKCPDSSEDTTVIQQQKSRGFLRSFKNHIEAARAFCKGEFKYYVGDLEIVTANARRIVDCRYEPGTQTYTNDRYAIFGRINFDGNSEQDQKRRELVMKFYQILSQKIVFHPSLIDDAFYDTFYPFPPSDKLETFFWSVRGARQ